VPPVTVAELLALTALVIDELPLLVSVTVFRPVSTLPPASAADVVAVSGPTPF
jgi:hypothetical protein